MYDERLSVAQHVAQRKMQRSSTVAQQNMPLVEIVDRVAEHFRKGKKLDANAYANYLAEIRDAIAATDPISVHETIREATRIRPNSGGMELLVLTRSVEPSMGKRAFFMAKRVLLTRKKAVVDLSWPGVMASQHLFERAVERRVSNGGSLDDVEDAIVGTIGMSVVWRHAFRQGRTPSGDVAMPLRGGLLLGSIDSIMDEKPHRMRCSVTRDCRTNRLIPESAYQVGGPEDEQTTLCVSYSTIVSEDMLRPDQAMLRDSIDIFVAKYRVALDELARSICWEDCEIAPNRTYADTRPALDFLAEQLALVLEENRAGLIRRRRQHPALAQSERSEEKETDSEGTT